MDTTDAEILGLFKQLDDVGMICMSAFMSAMVGQDEAAGLMSIYYQTATPEMVQEAIEFEEGVIAQKRETMTSHEMEIHKTTLDLLVLLKDAVMEREGESRG
ncbi:MAG: hypothetical protein LUC89_09905 [Oscillospiraceae bacterium]|nr:hypothetical protein [Oscillospiraceae bacterium]